MYYVCKCTSNCEPCVDVVVSVHRSYEIAIKKTWNNKNCFLLRTSDVSGKPKKGQFLIEPCEQGKFEIYDGQYR
jgi:hypothetical protein